MKSSEKMEAKKEKKRGFWASLFSPKSCSCSCGGSLIVETGDGEDAGCSMQDGGCGCGGTEEVSYRSGSVRTDVREIKVLGPGCAKCRSAYGVIERVIMENGLDVRLTKVDDIGEMMSYSVIATPAVVIDGTVRMKGRVPTAADVRAWLGI